MTLLRKGEIVNFEFYMECFQKFAVLCYADITRVSGVLNGEGSLLYPGDRTERYTGQPNVDGPVSSIRFELLREGLEDYEYLWMLEAAGEKKFADEQVRNLVIDVSAFSRNLDEVYNTRKAMARHLEKVMSK